MKLAASFNEQYKYIYFLSVLYMTFMTCSSVLTNKLINTPIGIISAASLVSPFWFALGDLITEIYGLKIIMRLFWSVIICQFIFSLICLILINLKSPISWHGQEAYDLVLGHLLRYTAFQFVGISVGWSLNAKLLSRWKILLRGKYFWLRSVGSSGLGMIIFSCISVFPSIIGMFPINTVISIVIWSCVLKIFFMAILALPSTVIVALLKNREILDNEQEKFKYNALNVVA